MRKVPNNRYHHLLIASVTVALTLNPLVGSAAIISGGHHGVTSVHGSRSIPTSRPSFHSPTRSGGFRAPSSHGVTGSRHFTTTRNFRSPSRSIGSTTNKNSTSPNRETTSQSTGTTTPKTTASTSHLTSTTNPSRPAVGTSSANRQLIHSPREQRSYNHWAGYYHSHYPNESANSLFDHLWFWIPMWLLVRSQATGQANVNVPTDANGQAQHWIKVGSKVVFVPTDIWAKVQPGDHVKLIDDQHLSINGKIYQR